MNHTLVIVTESADEPVGKPFANEHAARQTDPGGYVRFRRKQIAPGVHAVVGFKRGGGSEAQSIRFDADKFSPSEARAWLAEHDMQTGLEEATRKAARVVLKSKHRRTLYAVAMRPDEADAHGETTSKEEVRKAAHGFMNSREINLNHAGAAPGVAHLVESFVAYAGSDTMHGEKLDEPIREGDWLIGVHLDDDELANNPDLITGVSIEGVGDRSPA